MLLEPGERSERGHDIAAHLDSIADTNMPVPDPKTVKNRVHLNLTSTAHDRDQEIQRRPRRYSGTPWWLLRLQGLCDYRDMFRGKRPQEVGVRTIAYHPSFSQLWEFKRPYENSPRRFAHCAHGHLVDLYDATWDAGRVSRGNYCALAKCSAHCPSCSTYGGSCTMGVLVGLPVDTDEIMTPTYQPRQSSDAWHQEAAVLPRTDGPYVAEVGKSQTDAGTKVKNYEGILFTGWGTVFAFDFSHEKYLLNPRPYVQDLNESIVGFGHPGQRDERRGLYAVHGTAISFTAHDMDGARANYDGTIDGNAKELKLSIVLVGHNDRKPWRYTYKHERVPGKLLQFGPL